MGDRHFAVIEDCEKILCGCFHEPYPAQPVEGSGAHGADAAGLGGILAVCLYLFHDALPCPLGKCGIGRRQVSASDLKIEDGLPVGFVSGMKEREGFGLVLRAQTDLFPGRRVLAVINTRSPEEDESLFHN